MRLNIYIEVKATRYLRLELGKHLVAREGIARLSLDTTEGFPYNYNMSDVVLVERFIVELITWRSTSSRSRYSTSLFFMLHVTEDMKATKSLFHSCCHEKNVVVLKGIKGNKMSGISIFPTFSVFSHSSWWNVFHLFVFT